MSIEQTLVPFVNLCLQHKALLPELLAATERVLYHGQSVLGPEVLAFEERFASYCGVRYAIGVDNGTNALLLTLRALGIGPGCEVITAANSFLASASCIALAGATPVLVDVRDDLTIDPDRVEKAITPRTRAVIPVHLTGRPADMSIINDLAARHGLWVVEDAAQAVGAEYEGRRVGSLGKAGCFSLHPLKVLGAVGDGGVVTTSDPDLYQRLLIARNHGLMNRDECAFWSYNARLDTLQAALLLVKMECLEEWIEARRQIAARYRNELRNLVVVPEELAGYRSVYQTFVIRCRQRDALQAYLEQNGIQTKVHYPIPIHLQPAAAGLGYASGSFPVTERHATEILSLPIYPELIDSQVDHVISAIRSFYESAGRSD